MKIKIFADGADIQVIQKMAKNPVIQGFTTNPTLMRKSNVGDYKAFSLEVLKTIPNLPISFEVFSDDFREMKLQALEIASWGKNVYVKIPVSNTKREFSGPLIKELSDAGVQVNVTAMMTVKQTKEVLSSLSKKTASYLSLFAGRIADTGRDPLPIMQESLELMKTHPKSELIWASPRELLNVFQADAIGCHVITATADIIAKLSLVGKDLDQFSLDTVQMFYQDAVAAKFTIPISQSSPNKESLKK